MPVDVVGAPGANRSVCESLLLKHVTWFACVVASVQPRMVTAPTFESHTAPTEMVLATHAGTAICVPDPWFPVEANTEVPFARSALMAVAKERVTALRLSQSPAKRKKVPKLMLTTPTSGWLARIQSRPA